MLAIKKSIQMKYIRYTKVINKKRVCQNRHILLFVFLQARRGKILSMPLF